MGFTVFEEAARNVAGLVTAEEEGLVFAGLVVFFVELGDDFFRATPNFGAFERGTVDGEFAVGAAVAEGEVDTRVGVIKI